MRENFDLINTSLKKQRLIRKPKESIGITNDDYLG